MEPTDADLFIVFLPDLLALQVKYGKLYVITVIQGHFDRTSTSVLAIIFVVVHWGFIVESFQKQLKRLIQVQKLSFSFFLNFLTILRGGSGGGSFPSSKIMEPDEIATSLLATVFTAIAGAIVFSRQYNVSPRCNCELNNWSPNRCL